MIPMYMRWTLKISTFWSSQDKTLISSFLNFVNKSKLANSTYCSLNVFSQKQSPVSAYADLPTSHMIFSLYLLSSISKPLTDSYRTPLKVSYYNPGSIFFHPSGTFKLLSCSSASFSPQPIQLKWSIKKMLARAYDLHGRLLLCLSS